MLYSISILLFFSMSLFHTHTSSLSPIHSLTHTHTQTPHHPPPTPLPSQEIERLNEECLELEDQVTALKSEVKEAWYSYKCSQERAAVREAELQDEIRQVRKLSSTQFNV